MKLNIIFLSLANSIHFIGTSVMMSLKKEIYSGKEALKEKSPGRSEERPTLGYSMIPLICVNVTENDESEMARATIQNENHANDPGLSVKELSSNDLKG